MLKKAKRKRPILVRAIHLIALAILLCPLPHLAYSQTNDATLQPVPSMVVYGDKNSSDPRFRLWDGANGTDWSAEDNIGLGGLEELVAQSDFRGLWRFDEALTAGTTATDDSGNNNHGTINGATRIVSDNPNGSFGNALSFDGSNDYVQINNSSSLENVTESSFTFEAWAKPQDVPPTDCTANSNTCRYTVVARPGFHAGIFYSDTQKFEATIWNASDVGFSLTSGVLAPGTWHHLVLVVDDVAKRMSLYVDGQPVSGSPQAYTGALRDYGTSAYYIGAANPPATTFKWHFKGSIDEAAIYGRALAQNEVQAHFHNGILLGKVSIVELSEVVLRASPTKDEKVLGVQNVNGQLNFLVWDGTGATWGNRIQVTTPSGIVTHPSRSFDIAYEQQSGRVLVVYGERGSMFPRYRTWNGTGWIPIPTEPPLTVPVTQATGVPVWVRLESRPNSNEILLVYQDTRNEINSLVWDGATSSFKELEILGDGIGDDDGICEPGETCTHDILLEKNDPNATPKKGVPSTIAQAFDVAYEQNSCRQQLSTCQAVVAWARIENGHPIYRSWNGTAWTAELQAELSAQGITDRLNFVRLVADPGGDRIALGTSDANSDLYVQIWDGNTWFPTGAGSPFQVTNDLSFTTYQRSFDLAWESLTSRLVALYGGKNPSGNFFRTWTFAGGWSSQSSFGTLEELVAQGDFRGLWHFDEALTAGTTATDDSGNNNHGTINGATRIASDNPNGSFGNALSFDGSNDYVQINNSSSLENVTESSFTFEAWAKPQDTPPTNCTANSNTCRYTVVARPGFHAGIFYADTQRFEATIWNASDVGFSLTSGVLAPGTWHHLVLVVDDVAKQMSLYVDGQPVSGSPQAYTGALRDYGTSAYYIGAANPPATTFKWHFKGSIDEAAIYGRALAQNEIQAHFQNGILLGQLPVPVAVIQVRANPNANDLLAGVLDTSGGIKLHRWNGFNWVDSISIEANSSGIMSLFDQETGSLITVYPENFMMSYAQHFVGKQLTVISANPNILSQGAGQAVPVDVTISGTSIVSGATVSFSGSGITVVNNPPPVSSDGRTITPAVRVDLLASPGTRNVTITNPGGQVATGFGIVTVKREPTITGTRCGSPVRSPCTLGPGATNQTLTITGQNFDTGGVTVTITDLNVTVTGITTSEITTLVSVVASATPGSRDVTVRNDLIGQVNTGLGILTINPAPNVISVLPSSRTQGSINQTLTLTGSNFQNGAMLDLNQARTELIALGGLTASDPTKIEVSNGAIQLKITGSELTPDSNTAALWHFNRPDGKQLSLGDLGGVPDANLRALWHFNESGGTMANDSSGNNNRGVSSGGTAQTTAGKFSRALSFDGSNDYVQIDNSASLENLTESSFTFEGWAKPQDIPPTDCTTNSNTCRYAVVARPGFHTGIFYTNTQTYETTIWNSSDAGFILTSGVLAPGAWHHLVLVVDDVAKQMHFYVDGQPVSGSPLTYTGTLRDYGTSPYYIGAANPPATTFKWHFKGTIDEVSIYNTAISASSVSDHYSRGRVKDATANGNDGDTNGALSATGRFLNALSFDGVDDYVSVPRSTSLSFTNSSSFTAESWFQLDLDGLPSVRGEAAVILQQCDSGGVCTSTSSTGSSPLGRSWFIVGLDNIIRTNIGNSNLSSGIVVTPGLWYHTAVVYDNGTLRIYVNGLERAATPATYENSTGDYVIGTGKGTNRLKGIVEEMAIYRIALSASTIQEHFNRGLYSQTFEWMQTPPFSGGPNLQSWDRLVVGLTGTDSDGTVQVSYSTNGGATFSTPKIVTSADPEVLLTGVPTNPIIFRVELRSATGINKRDVTALDLHYTLNDIAVNNPCIFDSATQLRCTVSLNSDTTVGSRDVTVTNPDGGVGRLIQGFTITPAVGPPSVNGVVPSTVTQGEVGRLLTIHGTGFVSTPGVSFNPAGISTRSIKFVDPLTLQVVVDVDLTAIPGPYTLRVTNPDGQFAEAALSVQAIEPVGTPFVISGTTTLDCASSRWAYNNLTIASGASLVLNCDVPLKVYNTLRVEAISPTNFGQIVVDPLDSFVTILAGEVIVQANAIIQSDGKGCSADTGYDSANTRCSVTASGLGTNGGGGGYGGIGGNPGRGNGLGGLSYDETTSRTPLQQGSGGGRTTQAIAGSGGGAIRLDVSGTLTLDGVISSKGQSVTTLVRDFGAGGGSGGAIYVTAGLLTGGGSFDATGGSGGGCSGGGGVTSFTGGGGAGGRIGIELRNFSTFSGGFNAAGGIGGDPRGSRCVKGNQGSPGTLFISDPTNSTTLTLQGDVRLPFDQTFRSLEIPLIEILGDGIGDDDRICETGEVCKNVTLSLSDKTNLTLTESTSFQGTIQISRSGEIRALGDLSLPTGARISADEGGCASDQGYDVSTGQCTSGAIGKGVNGSGAGYGGEGGTSGGGVRGGRPYGSASSPAELGSGGGSTSQAIAGAGGGAIRLDVTGTLTLGGAISSNGQSVTTIARDFGAGGGSGGSIYVTADRLLGSGGFVATGGTGGACSDSSGAINFSGGGGGGGRIAIDTVNPFGFTGSLSAQGGPGGTACRVRGAGKPGASGTASINLIPGPVPDTIPPGRITDLRIDTASTTTSSIKLLWTATGDDGNIGQASGYIIKFSTRQIVPDSTTPTSSQIRFSDAISVGQAQIPKVAGQAESFVVLGLLPATTYYFAVVAVDEVGLKGPLCDSNGCAVTSGTTAVPPPDTTSPGQITNLQVVTNLIRSNSMVLIWTATADDGTTASSGKAASFDLRYSTKEIVPSVLDVVNPVTQIDFDMATQVDNEPVPGPQGTIHTLEVSGLSSNTIYYFAIRAVDEAGNPSTIGTLTNTNLDCISQCKMLTALRIGWNFVSVPTQPQLPTNTAVAVFGDNVGTPVNLLRWNSRSTAITCEPPGSNCWDNLGSTAGGSDGPVEAGKGYFLFSTGNLNVIDVDNTNAQDVTSPTFEVSLDLEGGFNMIANPYKIPVRLQDTCIKPPSGSSVSFVEAMQMQPEGWVDNALYTWRDDDDSYLTPVPRINPNNLDDPANPVLLPWKGYGIRMAVSGNYSIIFRNPAVQPMPSCSSLP